MNNQHKQLGYKVILLFFVLGVAIGCRHSQKIPVAPNKEILTKLLSEIEKLDQYLGLAVISATPPENVENSFSTEDIENRVKRINKEMEYLQAGEEESSNITNAQKSLSKYINSNDPVDWENSWMLLSNGIEGFSDFSRSSIWNELVPLKESEQVISQIDKLKSVMKEIRDNQ